MWLIKGLQSNYGNESVNFETKVSEQTIKGAELFLKLIIPYYRCKITHQEKNRKI